MPRIKPCSAFAARQLLTMELDVRGAKPPKPNQRILRPDFQDASTRIIYTLSYCYAVIKQQEEHIDQLFMEKLLAEPQNSLDAPTLEAPAQSRTMRNPKRPRKDGKGQAHS